MKMLQYIKVNFRSVISLKFKLIPNSRCCVNASPTDYTTAINVVFFNESMKRMVGINCKDMINTCQVQVAFSSEIYRGWYMGGGARRQFQQGHRSQMPQPKHWNYSN